MMFWLISMLLLAVALAFILPPLLRKPVEIVDDRRDQNIYIMKQQQAELEAEFKVEKIEKETYQAEKQELEQTLNNDLNQSEDTATNSAKAQKQSRLLIILVGFFIPLLTVTMYLKIGTPEAIAESPVVFSAQNMIRILEEKLDSKPKDVDGWVMLGRSYKILERPSDAIHAYKKAAELKPNDPNILLQLADLLGIQNEGDLTGKAEQLILKALDKDPDNLTGLWLAGVSAKQRGAGEEAILFWHKLVPKLAPDSEERKKVLRLIADIKAKTITQ